MALATRIRSFFIGCVLIGTCQPLMADVLILTNGDRITGTISRIWDNEVTIKPEYSDEFAVKMEIVDHIESDRKFEFELQGGVEIVAIPSGEDDEGNQLLETEDETVAVPLEEVAELDEPEPYKKWDSHVNFSLNLSEGNTESLNTVLKADSTLKLGDHRHIGEMSFAREELDKVTTKEQDLYKYTYNWLFRDPLFFDGQVSFERDPIIALDSRVIITGGLGRDIWNSPERALSISLGAGFQSEDIGGVSDESAVALWTLRYSQDLLGGNVKVFHNHSITNNLSGRTNTSFKTSTGLSYKLTDILNLETTLDVDYESDPIAPATEEDITLLIGIGADF